jgi:hypothetical protein
MTSIGLAATCGLCVVQLFFDSFGQTSNFSPCIDPEGLRLKEFQNLWALIKTSVQGTP